TGDNSSIGDTNSAVAGLASSSSIPGLLPTTRSFASARSTAGSAVLPAQAHLTDRDRQIADWLDRHGVLTTAQITAAFFASPITAAHRLAKLRTAGLVDRLHRPTTSRRLGPWHWVLGPLGAQITAATRHHT